MSNKEGYTFLYWQKGDLPYDFNEPVYEDITLVAKWEINKYKVRFVNYDDSLLEEKEIEYNKVPTYNGLTPTKNANETYTYHFIGWDREIKPVTKEVTYKAKYESKYIDYKVTFVYDNGQTNDIKTYHYGDSVVIPTIETIIVTPEYTYTFIGWDKSIETVTGNVTYTAQYSKEKTKYTVTFINHDGTILQEKQVEYGVIPTYTAQTPTKVSDETYTYTFDTWDTEIVSVVGEATYKAAFKETYIDYEVTFVYDNGTKTDTKNYHYGDTVTIPTTQNVIVTPEYTYTFINWDKTILSVTGDVTYTAQYSKEKTKYTVTFINHDGTILQQEKVEYGVKPIYNNAIPTKTSNETYTYSFDKWNTEIVEVDGDATYTATFKESYIDYKVTFVYDNGQSSDTKNYHYGETVEVPTIQNVIVEPEYTYTFTNWDKIVENVTGNVTYTANYDKAKTKYTIKFVNHDGTVLQEQEVEYGVVPTYNGIEPTKASDETYTYTFNTWDTEVAKVEGEATYKATFNETYIDYSVTFVYDNGTKTDTKNYHYGETVEVPTNQNVIVTPEYTYTFTKWDKSIESVTGDVIYTAQYSATKNKYKITFQNYDGTVLQQEEVEYGVKPTYDGATPTKASDETYTYTFNTWDTLVVNVAGETTYTATFKQTYIDYTVKFIYDNGTKTDTKNYHYGNTVVIPNISEEYWEPEYTYTFTNWDKTVENVTGDVTYTAQYSKEKNKYTVTYKNTNNQILDTEVVDYGTELSNLTAPTAQDGYLFNGYKDKQLTERIIENTTLVVKYAEIINVDTELSNGLKKVDSQNYNVYLEEDTVVVDVNDKDFDFISIWNASEALDLLAGLTDSDYYSSVKLSYDNNSNHQIEAKNLNIWTGGVNVARFVGLVATGTWSGSYGYNATLSQLVTATAKKPITVTVTLADGYLTSDGKNTIVYKMKFTCDDL